MNSFGINFRVSIFGESHGKMVGVLVDGCPAGISLTETDLENDIFRRKSGAKGTTPRIEADIPNIVSGVFNGHTTGAPITILFHNTNTRSRDYSELKNIPRPGHADFVASQKFGGFQDYTGGGHFSGRITTGLVAAGVIAKKIIDPVIISTEILEIGGQKDYSKVIDEVVDAHDSVGGIIECRAQNMPVGLGEPFFESTEARLAHSIFSIPAIKGIEFGVGFAAAKMRGSQHNDCFVDTDGKTATNNAGGINGGITNGNELVFRVVVKPTSSIAQAQHTMNMCTGEMTDLQIEGRHDACIALRIPVVVEAATAITLADLMMIQQERNRVIAK